ncbi:MAG TPA: hypothetical protein VLE99_02770 [Candidatus Saccharimonadales bacterium]|nr:hypothetical protein [Candidatus Saccharimonadales bacterium]
MGNFLTTLQERVPADIIGDLDQTAAEWDELCIPDAARPTNPRSIRLRRAYGTLREAVHDAVCGEDSDLPPMQQASWGVAYYVHDRPVTTTDYAEEAERAHLALTKIDEIASTPDQLMLGLAGSSSGRFYCSLRRSAGTGLRLVRHDLDPIYFATIDEQPNPRTLDLPGPHNSDPSLLPLVDRRRHMTVMDLLKAVATPEAALGRLATYLYPNTLPYTLVFGTGVVEDFFKRGSENPQRSPERLRRTVGDLAVIGFVPQYLLEKQRNNPF